MLVGAAVLAVLLGVISIAYGQRIGLLAQLWWAHPPHTSFASQTPPPAPNYRDLSNWAALPPRNDTSKVAPPGAIVVDPKEAEADVFFIHPTTYYSKEKWNQPLDDSETNERTDNGPIRQQASVFNGCCRIYAPRYRQATFGAFLEHSADSDKAMALAYSDVKRAFEFYLRAWSKGRPFFIAAHSQGSRYALRLLKDVVANNPKLRKRMIAAYVVGNYVSLKSLDEIGYKPCAHGAQVRCVLSWNSVLEGSDAQELREDFAKRSGLPKPSAEEEEFVCTNPINWVATQDMAYEGQNKGGWIYGNGSSPRSADRSLVGGRCDNGVFFVTQPRLLAYRVAVLPGGNYHMYDWQLSYLNIRENAIDRVDSLYGRRH